MIMIGCNQNGRLNDLPRGNRPSLCKRFTDFLSKFHVGEKAALGLIPVY